ncbi:MAG: trypsin-like peptidase domain-containing protein [Planctomycetaceae bacterium]|jgi:S1-C subfamily serine protease|nr:trypsin-like peptidase domain-containing protein [Planctomycetaceae bacterium]MDG2388954.1 trypsin-like peptidase domain-containing protein [Planctomycetaceae bacterium]
MNASSEQQLDPQFNPQRTGGSQQFLLVMILMVLVGVLVFQNMDGSGTLNSPLQSREITPRGELGADEQATIQLFEELKNSTVFIQTRKYTLETRRGFRLSVEENQVGVGTGFIWDKSGHIVTNFHVIQNADGATVQLADESVYEAKVVGASPEQDLAVLKIEAPAESLHPIPVGTSADLKVGQTVVALGYPLGLNLTLTKGVISGLDQLLPLQGGSEIHRAIQTDASINPGNSGGPLLDSEGRLIGVNTAIILAPAGFGFAIPVDTVRDAIEKMSKNPLQTLPTLGIIMTDSLAHLETGESRRLGVQVMAVFPGGPADKAGIQGMELIQYEQEISGDIILAIEEELIDHPSKVNQILSQYRPGDQVILTIFRQNQPLEVPVILQ